PPDGSGTPFGGAGFTSRYGLVRPRDGRYLAGVCAAVGRATNTDPVLWRVLLAVLGFFGGIGILIYVTAWLIIPGEGDSASPVESMLGRGRSSMSPVTVIVLSILVAVSFGFIVTDAFRAVLLGAARVIVIDRLDDRLAMAREQQGVATLNYRTHDVGGDLLERSGGRGPDVCIDAVGMPAPGGASRSWYDLVRQRLRPESERPVAAREAVHHCRKGGSVFLLGAYPAGVDNFPLGAVMSKGLTLRGAQQHGHRYIPMLLERMARGEIVTEQFATHTMPLDAAPDGYAMFQQQTDGCVRAVFEPSR
ncbi:PspC domain-containing protein, partial [Micromonospora craterilacus]|uniref:PspC domain-containing protein n=1 Tax=Micromonospora craterilacus TaxID=1655439 RepID=UPI001F36C123